MTPSAALPPELADEEERKWAEYREAADSANSVISGDDQFDQVARRVFLFSDFATRCCLRQPQLLSELYHSGDLNRIYPTHYLSDRLAAQLADVGDEIDLMRRLRRFRNCEMVRIAWRELSGSATVEESLVTMSFLADAVLDRTHQIISHWQGDPPGLSKVIDNHHQSLIVIGMGKLGASELNFSSDVDLVFAYPEPGTNSNGMTNEAYFTRLGRQLIHSIHTPTADGFVFRIDMDLRPFGNNGPLVMHFDAMEDYFIGQGREWERYAWLKARPVAGDKKAGNEWLQRLKPFVYRRYLDYSVYESLREMKAGIGAGVKRRSVQSDIKLGPGGIREIEFFGQVFQLLRGGVIPTLQQRPILAVLASLAEENIIRTSVARDLSDAYLFLRQVENRLQMQADQQTHRLPSDEIEWWRLSFSMGFEELSAFRQVLDRHVGTVQSHFEALLEPEGKKAGPAKGSDDIVLSANLWAQIEADDPDDELTSILSAMGFGDTKQVYGLLKHLAGLPGTRVLSPEGRKRLDRLMPLLLKATGAAEQPEKILNRILDLVATIQTRSVYLAMLLENPEGIDLLVRLAEASPMIATLLAKHPVLLDELLDPRLLYDPPQRSEMEKEIAQRLAGIPADDLEFQIETLCVFKQVNTLRVSAADVTGNLPLMNVSDRLTDIAEIVLNTVVDLAWNHLVARHGPPVCDAALDRGFAVIAYGKLGGLELGYGSDLDLVFLHAGSAGKATTGRHPIDSSHFFARLGQRVIHLLSARTGAGILYEIDMRLRPDGSGGVLVTHIEQYSDYQANTARTWEHQALIKARPVIGDPPLMDRFQEIRQITLKRPRNAGALAVEVREMAEKLRTEHGSHDGDHFNIKFDPGGMVDIEFLVQYLVLRLSADHSELVEWTDNVRLIQTLIETGILGDRQAYLLKQAYLSYRLMVHRLVLQEKPVQIDTSRFQNRRRAVRQIWRRFLGKPHAHTNA